MLSLSPIPSCPAHSLPSIMTTSSTALAQAKIVNQKKPEGLDLYLRFALAGALGCSVTHGAFTPVDVSVVPSELIFSLSFSSPITH